MDRLSDKWQLWKSGALVLFLLLVAVGATGALLGVILTIAAEAAGADAEAFQMWTFYTLPLWAPFSVGAALRTLPNDLRGGRLN